LGTQLRLSRKDDQQSSRGEISCQTGGEGLSKGEEQASALRGLHDKENLAEAIDLPLLRLACHCFDKHAVRFDIHVACLDIHSVSFDIQAALPRHSERENVEADILKVEAQLLNVEADVWNVEAQLLNVEPDFSNVEAEVLNVEAAVLNVEAQFLNVEAEICMFRQKMEC